MRIGRQNKITMAVMMVILVIGLASTLFYTSYKYNKNFFEYNGFTIYKTENDGLSTYRIQFFKDGSDQPFVINSRYHPKELEYIPIFDNLKNDLIKQKLYVTMDPLLTGKATIAFAEIDKYTENPSLFNLPTFPALLYNTDGNDLPQITCDNTTESISVIMFDIKDDTRIYNKNGCVIIEATDEDELIKAVDRLALTLLGIM